VFFAPLGATQN